jgi:excisionase family DNA binding protein
MQIQRWARAGRIPSTMVTPGGHFRFKKNSSLKKWIQQVRKHPKNTSKTLSLKHRTKAKAIDYLILVDSKKD